MLLLALLALAVPPPDLAATGVVVGPRTAGAAVLRSGGKARVVGIGDSAFGGKVVAITARVVTLDYEGRRVDVPLVASGSVRVAAPPTPAPATADAHGARSLEKREFDRRLGEEAPRILAETAISPVSEDGRVTGLAITRMPEGTLLSDAGLRAGDVLTRINDTPIDGLPTLMGLWGRLQGARDVHAEVLRNGQPVSLTLSLR
jgi:type II secretion system protein C